MTDVWSDRAAAYRESAAHREGPDLDVLVEWAAGAGTALDVATGGGHVARRLRQIGIDVVTTDAAPGMQPDVVCRGEDLPFADSSFDVVACRVAAHHFADVKAAVREMARVTSDRVLVVDNLYGGEALEEAERVRDPSHVRNYSAEEWRTMLEDSGLGIDDVRFFEKPIELDPWLARAGCEGEEAERVRELAADRISDGWITLERIAVKAVK
ncbi:MAG TPA: methyltransferase domain-containing protein [Gaiellaceae bacterium]|nr:methyltransferase domain-containing protein [Gaiellaceae bacterium]